MEIRLQEDSDFHLGCILMSACSEQVMMLFFTLRRAIYQGTKGCSTACKELGCQMDSLVLTGN